MAGQNNPEDLACGRADLRRSPLAWAKFLGLCAAIVMVPGVLFTAMLRPSPDSNPRRNLKPAEEARQVEARAEAQEYRKQQRYWLARIEAGEASFGEAACVLDRGGEWDSSAEVCAGKR